MPGTKTIVVTVAAVVGAVVLWRLLRAPITEFAGNLVTTIGGKAVADAAQRAAMGDQEYAKVIAMNRQKEIG